MKKKQKVRKNKPTKIDNLKNCIKKINQTIKKMKNRKKNEVYHI